MNLDLTRNWLEKVADACRNQRAEQGSNTQPAAPETVTRPGEIMSDEQRVFGARYRRSMMGTVDMAGIKLPEED